MNASYDGFNMKVQACATVEIDADAQQFHKTFNAADNSLLFHDCAEVDGTQRVRPNFQ